ncbi:MAG: phosphoribosyltransferase family protein [Lachnospiraceae bacterium]
MIIIDDIYTTGSTVEACSRILKKAGVKRIYFLAICIGKGR